ncbi:hypothetical protein [Candidatus Amarolinea aalborgensis]|uniref:hypothetical protein n=1 Tax=Candidatus Amarolinea aalborgensis TaxID=2249329 RepID=UPI003BFA0328
MSTRTASNTGRVSGGRAGVAPLERLTPQEKLLLAVPLVGGLVFGFLPLLAPGLLARLAGATGNDPFIYRLAGAATLGYAVALLLALRQEAWLPVRIVVIATLTFNLGSLYAIALAILDGNATWIVYAILVASISITAITASLLQRHRAAPQPAPDIAAWLVALVWFLAIVATLVGALGLFVPTTVARIFGYAGTDTFLYRQGGAATLGYGIMGFYQLRSRTWSQWHLPSVMALVFNGLSFILAVLALLGGESSLLPLIIGSAALAATVGSFMALQRQGR